MGVGGRQYWGENYKSEREYRIARRFSSLLCCEGRAAGAGVVLWRSVEGVLGISRYLCNDKSFNGKFLFVPLLWPRCLFP